MPKQNTSEYDIQVSIIDYLIDKYPGVLFRSDIVGVRLPIGLSMKVKKLMRGSNKEIKKIAYPDLFIAEPKGGWCGLYIELKRKIKNYSKNNNLLDIEIKLNDPHIEDQFLTLRRLKENGYCSEFSAGKANTIHLIDWYLTLPDSSYRELWKYSIHHKDYDR